MKQPSSEFVTYWDTQGIRLLGETIYSHIPTLEDRASHAFEAGRKQALTDLLFRLEDHYNKGYRRGQLDILLQLQALSSGILDGMTPETEERE